ncbi:MAG: antitoxin MazE family protein [Rhodospirillales bacterium]|nr:MAG: antitoxin MazE family protein [Rhodospirillales bacterium]
MARTKQTSSDSAPRRNAGLRRVTLWVPDTRSASFAAECRRQSLLLHDDPAETEILRWIESVEDNEGDARSR